MDEDIQYESDRLKDSILALLRKTVSELKVDAEERDEWLKSNTCKSPIFTRNLNDKKVSVLMSADVELQKKGQKKILTEQTKLRIKSVRETYQHRSEKVERKMRKAYERDLTDNPYYIGLSAKLLEGARKEFEYRLEKELKHIQRDCRKEIEEIISAQPILRKKSPNSKYDKTNYRSNSSRVKKIKEDHAVEIKEFLSDLAKYEEKERANLLRLGMDAKEVEEMIRKENVRKTIEINSRLTCETRMAEGKSLERQMMEDAIFDSNNLEGMIRVYITVVNKTIMHPRCNIPWEEVVLIIDRAFGLRPSWKDFVLQACTAWSNTADASLRQELDKRMKRYALLILDGYFEDVIDCDGIYTTKDVEIAALREEREKLVRKIATMDGIIAERVKQQAKDIQVTKERSLKKKPLEEIKSKKAEKCKEEVNFLEANTICLKGLNEEVEKNRKEQEVEREKRFRKKLKKEERILHDFYDDY